MKKLFLLALAAFLFSASAQAQIVPQTRQQITLSYAPLVKQVAPAVVNIYTSRKVQQNLSPLFADPLFRQFFGNAFPQGVPRERVESSLGSGVIIRGEGLIVTSHHVIKGADQIRVVLSDRREFDAVIVTADPHSDLAVLRVDTKGANLPYVELKDSDEIEIGDLVLAIGNPFGVGQTVTSGIISAVAHPSLNSSDLNYFIQTDAAINPGNSGGALITMDGKLVGINAAIFSQSGGNLGIGFAVPSNMVRVVMGAVAEGKKSIIRPWLGIDGQAITSELAASLNMTQPSGYLINSIHSASPVGKAGLKVGDVITSLNGRAINDPDSFNYRVATLPIGSKIDLIALRKGQKVDVTTTLIAPPEDPPRAKTEVTGPNPFAGATIQNLSPAVLAETNIRGIEQGVIMTAIKQGSVAGNIGFREGDIILAINGANMATVSDVLATVKKQVRGWRISFRRGTENITIMVN